MDNVSFVKEDGTWNYATYRRTSSPSNDPKKIRGAALSVHLTYSLYQVKNFVECLDVVAGGDFIAPEAK